MVPEHPSSRVLLHPASVIAQEKPDGDLSHRICGWQWDAFLTRRMAKLRGPTLSHQKTVEAVALESIRKVRIDRQGGLHGQGSERRNLQARPRTDESPVGILAVAFSPNGKLILTASKDGEGTTLGRGDDPADRDPFKASLLYQGQ